MTESQRKFLTGYLGECWHEVANPVLSSPQSCIKCGDHGYENGVSTLRTFTDLKDKQDLLEKIIDKNEWNSVLFYMAPEILPEEFIGFMKYAQTYCEGDFTQWLIQLSPIETAELVCKWKGEK